MVNKIARVHPTHQAAAVVSATTTSSTMECDDAAVERQKLVSNDEEDDQATITNLSSSGQAKSIQTPISPVLSNKVRESPINLLLSLFFRSYNFWLLSLCWQIFSSGETTRSPNSTSYTASLAGKTAQGDAPPATRLNYVNERRAGQDTKVKPKKIQRGMSGRLS